MSDDQVVRLLEEIRDIQKENAADYKVALQNQQEAMAIQKRGGTKEQGSVCGLGCVVYLPGRRLPRVSPLPGSSMGRSGTKRRRFGVKQSPYRTVGSNVIFNLNYYGVMNIPLCKDDLSMSATQQSEGRWISN